MGHEVTSYIAERSATASYTVWTDPQRGALVSPYPVAAELSALVARIQRVAWPLWAEPGLRIRKEVAELCRLQAARGLTVLSWLAGTRTPPADQPDWLLVTTRLAGPRQERMYEAAQRLPDEVRALVVANWAWVLTTPHGGQATASYLASGAYPDDGYAAAHAAMALLRLWERHPEGRQVLAAAWAATRTPANWCRAAELRGATVFTYPRGPLPPLTSIRPWVARLLGLRIAERIPEV